MSKQQALNPSNAKATPHRDYHEFIHLHLILTKKTSSSFYYYSQEGGRGTAALMSNSAKCANYKTNACISVTCDLCVLIVKECHYSMGIQDEYKNKTMMNIFKK